MTISVASKTILNLPISQLRSQGSLSIGPAATPCRFRLVNCRALVEEDTLVIDEFEVFPFPVDPETKLPAVLYAAISCVWKGNLKPIEGDGEGQFAVCGAESGDPISISVLRSACLAAQIYSVLQVEYIWFDRLCIIQTHAEDKAWQITQMFEVYKNTNVTIILPGGIQRLVGLEEETNWVHRAWTLQEALAPYAALVLHLWEEEEGAVGSWDEGTAGAIQVVQVASSGKKGCALTDLDSLVEACTVGKLRWTPGTLKDGETLQEIEAREWRTLKDVKIIGRPGTSSLHALLDALRIHGNVVGSFREYAIWKSALTRTSSRPVDMVFSIMGLFGITLDPKVFERDDRIGATIALSREILRKGGNACWIGVSTRAPPCRLLSTFPEFPETSVAGKALIRVEGGQIDADTIVDEDSHLGRAIIPEENMITGTMDEAGYLSFHRRACFVTPIGTAVGSMDCGECQRTIATQDSTSHPSVPSVDGKEWLFHEGVDFDKCEFPRVAAVPLAFFSTVSLSDEHNVLFKLMLVEEHAPGKFHIVSFFKIPDWDLTWEKKEVHWKKYEFSIGGPDVM